jgi:hypothetical protein
MAASIPPWPKGQPFEQAPTLEALLQRSGFKIAKLREKLRDVPRFKCPDNTVRYDDAAATAALDGGADFDSAELDDGAVSEPFSPDPVQAALQVMNRTLSLLSVVVRERGEIVKLCNETIRTMGEPMKLGQDLVREGVAVMLGRLKHYDEMWDGMVLLVEDLQSTRDGRARAAEQQLERSTFRRETFDLAKKYVPEAISKFQLTLEAQLAVDLLRGLAPEYVEPIIDLGVLSPELVVKARRLVELMKQRRASSPAAAEGETTPAEQQGGVSNGSS